MQTLRDPVPKIITLLLVAVILSGCFAAARKSRILERADRYFKAGEYDKAKIEYLNLLRADPQNATAFEKLGTIWFEEGAPLRAAAFLLKTRELAPNNLDNRAKLARVFMSVGQNAEARKEAVTILQQSPANDEGILILASTDRTKEDVAYTEQQLQKLPQRDDVSFQLALASVALQKQDLVSAENALQRALALDPKSSSAHLAMAFFHLLKKNQTKAGEEFKTAAGLAPARSTARLKYAEFLIQTKAALEAKVFLRVITSQAADNLPAWCLLAQIALTEKKYDESLTLLENVFGRDPENIDAQRLQAQDWLAKGDTKKAVAGLERLDKSYPNVPLIKYELARVYLQSNNPTQAAVAVDQAISASPNFLEAILLRGELNLSSGNAQPVVAAMVDLLNKQPDLVQAQLLLAQAYRSLGRLDDAAAVFAEQIKASPQAPDAYFRLGLVLRQQKKTNDARKAFEKALELAPDNLLPINQLVDLDISDKQYDVAMQRVQQQLQKTPQSAGAHFMEGKIYAAQAKWDLAEAAFLKTIELDANFADAYGLLISTYVATNKLPQAIGQLQTFLSKSPDNPQALMTLALIYTQQNDFPKARDAYERLLSKQADFAPALNNLAYLYAEKLNQLDKAYDLARKARTLQPGDPSTADTLGWILYKRADYQQALTLLQESAGKLPNLPEIQFHLGMAAYMMGQTEVARTAFQQAASAPADFPGKEESQRRLALLKDGGSKELSIGELEGLLKQQPNDLIALNRLAEGYEKQGEAGNAAAAYEQALKLNPKLPNAALKLAQLYAGPLQKRDKALEFAKKARELSPNDVQAAGALGRVAFQAGNFTWAYSLLQESARQGSVDPDILHDLAMTTYALGKVSDARQTMQRSLTARPDAAQSENAKRFLAMTALDQSSAEVVAAEPEVQKILKTQPDYVPALMAQAAIQLQRNDAKAAAGIYSQVLGRYPDFAPAQKRLAAIYAESPDDLAKAYDLAMKARKVLPDDPELARTLAELNFKRKEFAYAIQLFQESVGKQPLPAKDLYYLGMAQLQTKQDSKGRETLERALAAGLEDPFAQEAKHQLAEQQPK
jgi:tetratricopeptide (TPR) repeat protein